MEVKEIKIPDGYKFDMIVDDKIILKQNDDFFYETHNTWEKCYEYLRNRNYEYINNDGEVHKNMMPVGHGESCLAFMQLLVCREVYRQGWVPNYCDKTTKYAIVNDSTNICRDVCIHRNYFLTFQTAEVRNKFLKNFYDLITKAAEYI